MSDDRATAFKGTFAELYDRYLVPMNFVPYARMLAQRANDTQARDILEIAAGTGVVTLELARTSPPEAAITATDLSQTMVDIARNRAMTRNVVWRQADAMQLPFADSRFDLLVCQFGVMFFPGKQASFREAFRVLRPGRKYLLVSWDSWRTMPSSPLGIAADTVADLLGRDPVSLLNPPYRDEHTIRTDLNAARFQGVSIERMSLPAEAASAREAAVATVHGSLIRTGIEASSPERLDEGRIRSSERYEQSSATAGSREKRTRW